MAYEGEGNVKTNTTLQPKRKSSPRKSLTQNDDCIKKILRNEWWPFDRVDGKLLEKLNREKIKQTEEPALL